MYGKILIVFFSLLLLMIASLAEQLSASTHSTYPKKIRICEPLENDHSGNVLLINYCKPN